MLKARLKIKYPLHFEVIYYMLLQANIFLNYNIFKKTL